MIRLPAALQGVPDLIRLWLDSSAAVEPGDSSVRQVDWPRVLPYVVLHLACLGVFLVGWSPVAVGVAVALYGIRMFALTGLYHRYFSHRSFQTSRVVQFLFALRLGWFQGWDLNPAQLPTRYAAVFAFFLEALTPAAERLRTFVDQAAQATLVGDVFDDAATGQGLLNFFLRGLGCGAITEEEALATGLTLDELGSRSFAAILAGRS